jgi:hypothetical protein
MFSAPPPLRLLEKIASTCCRSQALDRVVLVDVHRQRVDRAADGVGL